MNVCFAFENRFFKRVYFVNPSEGRLWYWYHAFFYCSPFFITSCFCLSNLQFWTDFTFKVPKWLYQSAQHDKIIYNFAPLPFCWPIKELMKTFQISQFFIVIFYYLEAEIDTICLWDNFKMWSIKIINKKIQVYKPKLKAWWWFCNFHQSIMEIQGGMPKY